MRGGAGDRRVRRGGFITICLFQGLLTHPAEPASRYTLPHFPALPHKLHFRPIELVFSPAPSCPAVLGLRLISPNMYARRHRPLRKQKRPSHLLRLIPHVLVCTSTAETCNGREEVLGKLSRAEEAGWATESMGQASHFPSNILSTVVSPASAGPAPLPGFDPRHGVLDPSTQSSGSLA